VLIGDHERPVALIDRQWTGRLMRVDAGHLLRITARGISHVALPRMLNSVVPRPVLETVEEAYGDVFASIAPDHCFSYRCLDLVESIVHWDRVFVVQRALGRSNGYSQIRGVASVDHEDFLRELDQAGINPHAPVPELLTVTNAAYNEYEFVRRDAASSKLTVLRRHYYLGANARDVARLEEPALQRRMQRVLRDHGWSSRTRAHYLLCMAASAGGYYGRRPWALLRRLRSRPPAPATFGDPASAMDQALRHPGSPSAEAPHLWPLMSRPNATRELQA
jgi:hypothetical protein